MHTLVTRINLKKQRIIRHTIYGRDAIYVINFDINLKHRYLI